MSTTLLSAFYDIDFLCKVSRLRERMADGLEPFGVPRLGRRARLRREGPFQVGFAGGGKSWN